MDEIEELRVRVAALESKPRITYSLISASGLDWIVANVNRKSLIQFVTFVSTVIALTQNPLNLPDTKPVLPTLIAPILEQVSKDTDQ